MLNQLQTNTSPINGDCFRTCIAALLNMRSEDLPNFCGDYPTSWFTELDIWLRARGLRFVEIKRTMPDLTITAMPGTVGIAAGKSPRGEHLHAVIAMVNYSGGWEILMDPHPDDTGLDGPVEFIGFITVGMEFTSVP
jgi:hypothetical protein